jgi:purine-cytosine permease-like protein
MTAIQPDVGAEVAAAGHIEGVDAVGRVEARGVDFIPEAERQSKPANLTWVYIGGQFTFGTIVLGSLPVAFGLSWWSSVSAILLGVLLGSILVGPMAMFGPRTGTNGPVSSGAHFGVVGRIVGSFLALLGSVGFFALSVWTAGQAAVGASDKLFGLPQTDLTLGVAYALIVLITILIGVYGHATVVSAQKFLIPVVGIVLLVGVVVLADKFDAGYSGGEYALGGYWATWALGFTVALSLPLSYGPFVNDFARYISPRRYSAQATAIALTVGQFIGCSVAMLFAAYTATMISPEVDWVTGLVEISPTAYMLPLLLVALLGALGQGALCTYSTGLDLSSIVPAIKRVPATLIVGALALTFVLLGSLVWNAIESVSAFVLILVALYTPWIAIMVIGYVLCRGQYRPDDLQVFNRGERGGIYWFTAGWNWRALVAWLAGSVVGVLFIHTSLVTGPFAESVNGVDLSFISAAVVGGGLYLLFRLLWPETPVEETSPKAAQVSAYR